jgi:hypothetical protein
MHYEIELPHLHRRHGTDGEPRRTRSDWRPVKRVSPLGGFSPVTFTELNDARVCAGRSGWEAARIVGVTPDGERRIIPWLTTP